MSTIALFRSSGLRRRAARRGERPLVAGGDPSASWVVMILGAADLVVAQLSAEAQQEIYADGPDTHVCVVLTPHAAAERVDGGRRLSGEWFPASGCLHAAWGMFGFPIAEGDVGVAAIPVQRAAGQGHLAHRRHARYRQQPGDGTGRVRAGPPRAAAGGRDRGLSAGPDRAHLHDRPLPGDGLCRAGPRHGAGGPASRLVHHVPAAERLPGVPDRHRRGVRQDRRGPAAGPPVR